MVTCCAASECQQTRWKMRHSATQSELYTQVSKRGQGIRMHTALLGNDGWVVAFGNSDYGQCMIPPLTWSLELCIPRCLQTCIRQCFCEVMAVLLLVDKMILDNATSHLWMKQSPTRKPLLEGFIPCFSDRMEMLWLVETMFLDSAAFHFCRKKYHTPRFLQV